MMNVFREGLLRGKTALVTGGASGIGRGISDRLAAAGANVVIASRRSDLCRQVAHELAEQHGVQTLGIPLNVREVEQVDQCFAATQETMGGLDILVNNAAGNFYYPSHMLSDNQWRAIVETDLFGTFYCCRAAFPMLREQGGAIINISMTLHRTGWVGMLPACAAKSGIDALTQTLALEWSRHQIRVNGIAPGPVNTEGVRQAFAAGAEWNKQAADVPLGRAGEPVEIGGLVVFLASSAAVWLTGETICLDGGMHLTPDRGGVDSAHLEKMALAARSRQLGQS
ncbi:MAG: hypothetical protein CMJ75_12655 [Planctomycetaceae bacterium]|nr:hypothetical protein [Planctomycetaceae bacterium]